MVQWLEHGREWWLQEFGFLEIFGIIGCRVKCCSERVMGNLLLDSYFNYNWSLVWRWWGECGIRNWWEIKLPAGENWISWMYLNLELLRVGITMLLLLLQCSQVSYEQFSFLTFAQMCIQTADEFCCFQKVFSGRIEQLWCPQRSFLTALLFWSW